MSYSIGGNKSPKSVPFMYQTGAATKVKIAKGGQLQFEGQTHIVTTIKSVTIANGLIQVIGRSTPITEGEK